MNKKQDYEGDFYGAMTIGEKGQVVIPAEARKELDLKKGDKLLLFRTGDMLTCTKLAQFEKFTNHLNRKLKKIRTVLNQKNHE